MFVNDEKLADVVMKLKDKVAIVTGSARGIGRETALALAREGAKVVVTDILDEIFSVADQIKALGRETLAVKTDVSKSEEVKEMVKRVIGKFGRVDILVNNAGIITPFRIGETTDKEWDEVMAVNLRGVFNCCNEVLPTMMKQKSGKIVNISSVSGSVIGMMAAHYSASKGGVLGFTRTLAMLVAEYGINVNAVCPGLIATDITKAFGEEYQKRREQKIPRIPLKRLGQPIDVANAVVFLASDDSSYITGQPIIVDGGIVTKSIF